MQTQHEYNEIPINWSGNEDSIQIESNWKDLSNSKEEK